MIVLLQTDGACHQGVKECQLSCSQCCLHCASALWRGPTCPQYSDLYAETGPRVQWTGHLCGAFTFSSFESPLSACFSIFCCSSSRQLFGSYFHVNPMNFNGSDMAVTIGWLRKHGSLCSWPRLCCCQDSSRQLQFTILPWLHKTGPFAEANPEKNSQSSSAIGENYSSLGNWGRISRCHLTAKSHHQEASYSLRSQGS